MRFMRGCLLAAVVAAAPVIAASAAAAPVTPVTPAIASAAPDTARISRDRRRTTSRSASSFATRS